MSFTQLNQLAVAFKKLSGKTHTNASFGASNESIGSNVQLGSSTIFGDAIPITPSSSLFDITSGVVEKVRFELTSLPTSQYTATAGGLSGTTIDDSGDGAPTSGTFSNGIHAYALKLTGSYQTDSSNPLAGTTPFTDGYFMSGSAGTLQIIPDSFGTSYSAVVRESDGTQIAPLDEIDYYLDPYAGILFVQDYDSGTVPSFVDAYIFIGSYVSDKIDQAGIFTQTGSFYATSNDLQITGSLDVTGGVTGSFSGSFFGDGSGLSGVAASFPITEQTNLANTDKFFINDGASKFVTYGNLLTDLAGTNLAVEGTDSLTLATELTGLSASGSFSGSFQGDGSNLSGIASTLNISGSTGNGSVDLQTQTLTIAGTTNEIEAVASSQTITIGLPNDVTIGNDLTVTNDLTVSGNTTIEGNLNVNGTTTTISSSNLLISDKFALFASGSPSATDGGLIIQSDVVGTGLALGYDASATRWSLQNGLAHDATAITPDAYMVTATTDSSLPANPNYGGGSTGYGNIFVDSGTGEIYIYS